MAKSKEKAKAASPPAPANTLMSWLSPKAATSSSTSTKVTRAKSATPAPPTAKRRKMSHVIDIPSSDPPIASTSTVPLNCSPPLVAPPSIVYDVDNEEEITIEPDLDFDEMAAGDDFGPPKMMMYEDPDEAEVMVLDEDQGGMMMCCPICGKDLGMTEEKVAQLHVNRCLDLPGERARNGVKLERATSVKLERSPSVEARALKPMSNLEEAPPMSTVRPCKAMSEHDVLKAAPNAFTAIMNGHAEDKLWKEAAVAEREKGRRGVSRKAPFYKILEGMPLAVDAFRYGAIPGVKAYFLSHAHADHYTNLSASWTHGPIYCSITTANLIKMNLGVRPEYVKPMSFDEVIEVEGITITMLDANHCPGSSLFLFEGPQRSSESPWSKSPRIFRYLHTGDFRASPAHLEHPSLKGQKLDLIYLDTTYCDPRHIFPAQEQVINACSELIRDRVLGDTGALRRGLGGDGSRDKQEVLMKGWLSTAKKEEPDDDDKTASLLKTEDGEDRKPTERILVLIGTYSVGKERIVKGIAKAIGSQIYCTDYKRRLFECIDDPDLHALLTKDPLGAQVHVTNLFAITAESLANYLDSFKGHFTRIIGLRPTGWTFKATGEEKAPTAAKVIATPLHRNYSPAWLYPQRDSTERCQAYGVPYSEHSSFRELTCFCVSVDCPRFIATVNVHSEASRAKMKGWFERWLAERKRRRDAGEPLVVPGRTIDYW